MLDAIACYLTRTLLKSLISAGKCEKSMQDVESSELFQTLQTIPLTLQEEQIDDQKCYIFKAEKMQNTVVSVVVCCRVDDVVVVVLLPPAHRA